MEAGPRRHYLTFADPVETKDASTGQTTYAYTDVVATVWGRLNPVAGSKVYANLQLQASVTHMIDCPWVDGITTRTRVLYRSSPGAAERSFEILSAVNVGERNRDLRVQAKELV